MAKSQTSASEFSSAVIDALASHICVLNPDGTIIAVNRAWHKFGEENSLPGQYRSEVGNHYLGVCNRAAGAGSEEAGEFAAGVAAVLAGATDKFEMEYPCHSPTAVRWFLGRATRLDTEMGGAVISHMDITDRKLLEFELEKLASTDALTGLPNRRHFVEVANLEVGRVTRFGAEASVAMIDLDHFKSVNDRFGHAAGDEALRCFAGACRSVLRGVDLLARMGGEEFALLLPSTGRDGAAAAAEKMRRAVETCSVFTGEISISITASFGVSEIWPSDPSVEAALARADESLYDAKRKGRNRVEITPLVQFRSRYVSQGH